MELEDINGLTYEVPDTYNKECLQVLLKCMQDRTRVVLDYGNPQTKVSWNETCDVTGYIGRSTGVIKCLLLLHNSRSMGGSAILLGNILSIKTSKSKKILWELK